MAYVTLDTVWYYAKGGCFSPDGKNLYIAGQYHDQYKLSTPWDLSTAVQSSGDRIYARNAGVSGMAFSPDGLRMFASCISGGFVFQWDLGTPWTLGTAIYNGITLNTEDSSTTGIDFSEDGLKMFLTGYTNGGDIYEWDLGTAWDIGTAKYNDVSVQSNEIWPSDISFSPDGLMMFESNSGGNKVYYWELALPWDLSTATYTGTSMDAIGQPGGVLFSPDGTRMYELSSNSAHVYQHFLDIPWDISTASDVVPQLRSFPVGNSILFAKGDRGKWVNNAGSGNNGLSKGNHEFFASDEVVRFGDTGEIDTKFDLPEDHDWLMFEVYDVEGVIGDVGYTRWTDNVSDVINDLIGFQDAIDANTEVTNYKCKGTRYNSSTGHVDVYYGNESVTISIEAIDLTFPQPEENWIISRMLSAPTAPVLELTTISGSNAHDIQVYSSIDTTTILIDNSDGSIVDSAEGTDVIVTVPDTGDVRTYSLSNSGDPTQVQFLGTAKHSSCSFRRASSITSLYKLYSDAINLTSFSWDGECNATTARDAWRRCRVVDFPYISFPNCTSFMFAFSEAHVSFAGGFDTGSAEAVDYMFQDTSGGKVPHLDLRNTTSVTGMFSGSYIDTTSFDLTGVSSMYYMFQNYYFTGTIPPLNTSSVTDFRGAFYNCAATVTGIDTSNAINASSMFNSFRGGDIPALDFRTTVNPSYVFYNCTAKILGLDISGLPSFSFKRYRYNGILPPLDVSEMTSFYEMFNDCSAGFAVDAVFDTSSGTDFRLMFYYYLWYNPNHVGNPIPPLDLRNSTQGFYRWVSSCYTEFRGLNVHGVASVSDIFQNYEVYSVLPPMDFSQATNFNNAFYGCCSSFGSTPDFSSGTNFNNAFNHFKNDLPVIDMRNSTNNNYAFSGIESSVTIEGILLSGVTTMKNAFYNSNVTVPDGTDFSSVTDMEHCFYYSGSTIPSIDTSNVTNWYQTFYNSNTTSLGLIDMGSGVNMSQTFQYSNGSFAGISLAGLSSVDSLFDNFYGALPSSMDTTGVEIFNNMFCRSTCDVPSMDTSSGTSFREMFKSKDSGTFAAGMSLISGTDFTNMFQYCTISCPGMDLTGVNNISKMFYDYWYTGAIPNMVTTDSVMDFSETFRGAKCTISSLDTSAATNVSIMFGWFTGQLPPALDFTRATWSSGPFQYCEASIPAIDVSGRTDLNNLFFVYKGDIVPTIDTVSCENFSYMFYGCTSSCVKNVDTTNATDVTAMFDTSTIVTPDATDQALIASVPGIDWVNPSSCT